MPDPGPDLEPEPDPEPALYRRRGHDDTIILDDHPLECFSAPMELGEHGHQLVDRDQPIVSHVEEDERGFGEFVPDTFRAFVPDTEAVISPASAQERR